MANSEKVIRLLKIITLIQRDGAPLSRLAEECSVSERTIYRDIQTLSYSGMPIYFDDTCRKYRFTDQVFLKPLTFSVEEAAALLQCLQGFSKENTPLRPALHQAYEKVLSCLSAEKQKQVEQAKEVVDIRLRAASAVCQDIFACVEKAIRTKRQLNIEYYTKTSETKSRRIIHPYVIAFREGAWYLVAFCSRRDRITLFRMDRILSAEPLNKNFEMPRHFSAEAYFAGSWAIEQGEPIKVTLRFAPDAARWVREGRYHPTQVLTEQPDGSLLFEATVNGQREITRWILGYGPSVEVLSPQTLRQEIARMARAMAATYSDIS